MKTKITLLLLVLCFSFPTLFAQGSEYCEKPIGHLGDPAFADPNGRAILTISKINDNSLEVILAKSPDAPLDIDFIYVAVFGLPPVEVGTHDGAKLDQYRAVITFTGTPPAEVKFLNIQWKNPGSPGTWTLNDITVPFNASCSPATADVVKPVMSVASFISSSYNTATLQLTATDLDDSGAATVVNSFIANDAANNLVNVALKTDASGVATLTGLKAGTAYNLLIKAKDNNKNISENELAVTFNTSELAETFSFDDFEGAAKGWISVEGSSGGAEIVANPVIDGINGSAHAIISGRPKVSNNWAAIMLNPYPCPSYRYLHVMMLRNTIGTVPNAKISDKPAMDLAPVKDQKIIANVWHDVVFDLSQTTSSIDFLYFMLDRGDLTEDLICYVDEIELSNDATPRTFISNIASSEVNNAIVTAQNGTISIQNGKNVKIYNATGNLIAIDQSVSDYKTFTLNAGFYLVQVDNVVHKVILN